MISKNNELPNNPESNVENLQPFKKFCMTIGAIPSSYLECLTYQELLLWFCDYLKNTVIPTVNNNAEAVEELQNLYIELKDYVDNYFTNLDVQQEINNKLDTMAQDGSFNVIIDNYMQPYIQEQDKKITNLANQINSSNNLSPIPVNSVENMSDTSKIYLNTSDGYWYYYTGTQWVQGGEYLSPNETIVWEKGGFNNGNPVDLNYQIRTKNFISLNNFYLISVNNLDYQINLNCYDSNYSFLGFYKSNTSWNKQILLKQAIEQFPNAKYFKIFARKEDMSEIDISSSSYIDILNNLNYNFSIEQNFEKNSTIIPWLFGDLPNGVPNYNNYNLYTPDFINLNNIKKILCTNNNFSFALCIYKNKIYQEIYTISNTYWFTDINIQDVINHYDYDIDIKVVFRNNEHNPISYNDLNYLLFVYNKDDILYNYFNPNSNNYKNISILGDSISTFKDYIPDGYSSQYPAGDVTNVNDCWWKKIIDNLNLNLLINNSYAGSRVTNTNSSIPNAVTRSNNLSNNNILPDIILIEIGVNDFINNVPLGDYDGNSELTNDLSNFRSAYANLLKNINTLYPKATTYCCTILPMQRCMNKNFPQKGNNNTLLTDWNNAIVELAQLFNCKILRHDMIGITYQNQENYMYDYSEDGNGLHPNKAGMEKIAINDLKFI